MQSEIRLIVFDLGRVLVRICDGWQHACDMAGLPHRMPPREKLFTGPLHEALCDMETGRMDTAEFCRRAARYLGIAPADIQKILDIYLIEAYPGAGELLDELNETGLVTACLSNTNHEHWLQMFDPSDRAALPMHRIRHHFASHLLGLRKPDEAIYAHVERQTGFVPAQIVFFDDMLENVQGAQRRGWKAHQIARERDPIGQIRSHLSAYSVRTG
jgi:putative hydrolase of the HAD superfamily